LCWAALETPVRSEIGPRSDAAESDAARRWRNARRCQNLVSSPHVPILFKSNFFPEPLPEQIYSRKISRALWLVRFSGWAKATAFFGPICCGQQAYRMHNSKFHTLDLRAIFELKMAPWICGSDDGSTCSCDIAKLSCQQALGHLWLSYVINPSASAAPRRFGKLSKFSPWNCPQDLSRLRRDFLPMTQMTRLMIGQVFNRKICKHLGGMTSWSGQYHVLR
jgi:hypothetical protein